MFLWNFLNANDIYIYIYFLKQNIKALGQPSGEYPGLEGGRLEPLTAAPHGGASSLRKQSWGIDEWNRAEAPVRPPEPAPAEERKKAGRGRNREAWRQGLPRVGGFRATSDMGAAGSGAGAGAGGLRRRSRGILSAQVTDF